MPWKRLTLRNGKIVYEPLIEPLKTYKPKASAVPNPNPRSGWKKILFPEDVPVIVIISCRENLSDGTATTPTIIDGSDMLLNIDDFPNGAKGRLRVNWHNNGAVTRTLHIDLYSRFDAGAVSGSEVSEDVAADTWSITEGNLFSLPSGLNSFRVRYWISADSMDISKIELQIEGA